MTCRAQSQLLGFPIITCYKLCLSCVFSLNTPLEQTRAWKDSEELGDGDFREEGRQLLRGRRQGRELQENCTPSKQGVIPPVHPSQEPKPALETDTMSI